MKKLSFVLIIILCVIFLAACNVTDSSHTHDYTVINYNENAHWLECECKDKTAVEFHKGGTATCTDLAVCSVCSVEYGKLESHNYADGICSKCNSVDTNGTNTNESGISETAWNSMLDIDNFENFTFYMYAESPNGDTNTEESLIQFNGNTISMNGGSTSDPDTVALYKNDLLNIMLAGLDNFNNFTYDATNNVYNSNTQIVYELNVYGYNVVFTNDNVVVAIDANGHLSSMSCNMKQEFGETELNVVVTFKFSNYGTTQIVDPMSKKSEYIGEYVLYHIVRELISGNETTTYNIGDYYFGTVLSKQTISAVIKDGTGNDYISYNFGNEVCVTCNFVILDDNTAVAYLDNAVDLFENGNATDVFYFDTVKIDGQLCFVLNATLGNHNYAYYVVKAN